CSNDQGCWVLGAECWVLGCLVPGCLVPGCLVLGASCALRASGPAPSTRHPHPPRSTRTHHEAPAPSTQHPAPSTQHPAPLEKRERETPGPLRLSPGGLYGSVAPRRLLHRSAAHPASSRRQSPASRSRAAYVGDYRAAARRARLGRSVNASRRA